MPAVFHIASDLKLLQTLPKIKHANIKTKY